MISVRVAHPKAVVVQLSAEGTLLGTRDLVLVRHEGQRRDAVLLVVEPGGRTRTVEYELNVDESNIRPKSFVFGNMAKQIIMVVWRKPWAILKPTLSNSETIHLQFFGNPWTNLGCIYDGIFASMIADMDICAHVCVYVHIYAYMRAYMRICSRICIYECIYAYMRACMHICMNICIYLCIYASNRAGKEKSV